MGEHSVSEGLRGRTRTSGRRAARLAACAVLWLVACDGREPLPPASLSLLAVGDTGAAPSEPRDVRTQLAVAKAMVAEDRARPVHGIVLLGDNFYDDGLRRDEIVPRLRVNLVRPYCHFLALDGPLSERVANACEVPAARRHPVPIYALLGNHDHRRRESPGLQRREVSRYVPGWRMAAESVGVHELGEGVSLIALDSTPLFDAPRERLDESDAEGAAVRSAVGALSRALREARGPWRVLAAHHPVGKLGRGEEATRYAAYRRRVGEAITASGVRLQLALSGHEHSLQILAPAAPAPALQVIAGAGSNPRSIRDDAPSRRAGFEAAGFARVDLVGRGEGARLVVSLVTLPGRTAAALGGSERVAARWSVDRDGVAAPD